MTMCIRSVFLVFLLSPLGNYAQDTSSVSHFGHISMNDFTVNSPLVNENTNAVILAAAGSVKFEGNPKGGFTYVYKVQKRIKIITRKGIDLATIKINLYNNDDDFEKLDYVNAVSWNVENGIITGKKLSKEDVFTEKADDNHEVKKIVLPGVKEGSVIDYTYTIKSDFPFHLPSWEFQSFGGPTLWSEYSLAVPYVLNYRFFFQKYFDFFIETRVEGLEKFSIKTLFGNNAEVSTPVSSYKWVKKDLPEFSSEAFVYSPRNCIDKVTFQLIKTTFDGKEFDDVSSNWASVTEEFMKRKDFGRPLNEDNYWADDITEKQLNGKETEEEIAEKLYYYVQNNYVCKDQDNIYITTDLREVVKKKSGSLGDINLLFIALLRRKKITVFPLLLSTREMGRSLPDYPQLDKINSIICRATINGVVYYLSPAYPFLPFGKLPAQCYNGYGRVLSWDTTSVDLSAAMPANSCQVINFIRKAPGSRLEGSLVHKMGFFESMEVRENFNETGMSQYADSVKKSYSDNFVVTEAIVDNTKSVDKDLSVRVEYKMNDFDGTDIVYFTPQMAEIVDKNPFSALSRIYPVEMPYPIDNIYTLEMEIPPGYRIDEMPKSAIVTLNDEDGFFEYRISADESVVQLKTRLVVKKTIFSSDDYQTLRDFYAYVVKKEAEQIVFKKIK